MLLTCDLFMKQAIYIISMLTCNLLLQVNIITRKHYIMVCFMSSCRHIYISYHVHIYKYIST